MFSGVNQIQSISTDFVIYYTTFLNMSSFNLYMLS